MAKPSTNTGRHHRGEDRKPHGNGNGRVTSKQPAVLPEQDWHCESTHTALCSLLIA
jgi:hypothetical protein